MCCETNGLTEVRFTDRTAYFGANTLHADTPLGQLRNRRSNHQCVW